MTFDIKRLTKLLELTTSSFDGEALNAIRLANLEIIKYDLTWTLILSNKTINIVTPIKTKEDFIDDKIQKHNKIESMFKACLSLVRSESGLNFIQSLKSQYDSTGHLTDRQIEALTNWYNRL